MSLTLLPPEMWETIFLFLPTLLDRRRARLTCKSWLTYHDAIVKAPRRADYRTHLRMQSLAIRRERLAPDLYHIQYTINTREHGPCWQWSFTSSQTSDELLTIDNRTSPFWFTIFREGQMLFPWMAWQSPDNVLLASRYHTLRITVKGFSQSFLYTDFQLGIRDQPEADVSFRRWMVPIADPQWKSWSLEARIVQSILLIRDFLAPQGHWFSHRYAAEAAEFQSYAQNASPDLLSQALRLLDSRDVLHAAIQRGSIHADVCLNYCIFKSDWN